MAKSKRKTTRRAQEAEVVEPVETRTRRVEEEPDDNNRSLIRTAVIVVLVLLGLYLLFNFITNGNDEQNGDRAAESSETSQSEESEESEGSEEPAETDEEAESDTETNGSAENQSTGTTESETETEYSYTVGEGESYTTIARRAITSVDSDLTPAERVAAETRLANGANAEWLNAGQSLTLNKDTVRAAVDWAKGLSDEQKAAWQPYADLVAW